MSGSPRILRKQIGNFLEDFLPGQLFRHKGGKTVTEGLFTTFTEFSMTTNPLAKNARYARTYGWGGLVCPPGLVMLVAFSQTVEDVSENARANLEYVDMRFRSGSATSAPSCTRARSRRTRSRARCGCRRTSRRPTTSRWRTCRTPIPTSRTSSPARASSTRAAAR
ncbi:MAG: hypothetical protein NTZ61_10255 [Proteobacteria bacterium]|nr:hypothetical protein [Pseudomonadota bacterium]